MFRGCSKWTGDENGVVRLPNTVETIGGYGLADVKMTTLILGANFESITVGNEHSFAGTTNLKYVYAPASTTVLSQGNANFQRIFVTSTDETVLKTISNTTGIAITNVITWTDYSKNPESYASGKYIISGYNLCDAFYDGHKETDKKVGTWLGERFLSVYKVACPCGRNCGAETVIEELPALIVDNGYAYGVNSMLQGVAVNKALLEAYAKYFDGIKYGAYAALYQADGEVINADGTGINGYVAVSDYTARDFDLFDMTIYGIVDDYKATDFCFGAYIIADGEVYYINNAQSADAAVAVSYNDVANIVDAVPPQKEEEVA